MQIKAGRRFAEFGLDHFSVGNIRAEDVDAAGITDLVKPLGRIHHADPSRISGMVIQSGAQSRIMSGDSCRCRITSVSGRGTKLSNIRNDCGASITRTERGCFQPELGKNRVMGKFAL